MIPDSRASAFFAKVAPASGPHGCMEWQGGTNTFGYGLFKVQVGRKRINRLAHRIAYQIATDEDPASNFVRHACDNPKCCNPAHLSIGTQRDNENDKRRSIAARLNATPC